MIDITDVLAGGIVILIALGLFFMVVSFGLSALVMSGLI
jgi:hypothetical protein